MKEGSQKESSNKKCIVPGCGKTLPSDAVLPVCEQHLDEAKDKGLKIGGGILTVAGSAFMFVKKDGMKYVGKAADLMKRFIK